MGILILTDALIPPAAKQLSCVYSIAGIAAKQLSCVYSITAQNLAALSLTCSYAILRSDCNRSKISGAMQGVDGRAGGSLYADAGSVHAMPVQPKNSIEVMQECQ